MCLLPTPSGFLFGGDSFYSVSLTSSSSPVIRSLAPSHIADYPIAIIAVSANEFLLAYQSEFLAMIIVVIHSSDQSITDPLFHLLFRWGFRAGPEDKVSERFSSDHGRFVSADGSSTRADSVEWEHTPIEFCEYFPGNGQDSSSPSLETPLPFYSDSTVDSVPELKMATGTFSDALLQASSLPSCTSSL